MDKIHFLVMDVDGTLTDGKIYMGENGEVCKAFNVKDGCGIKDILPIYHIIPIIITARESNILLKRCEELNITKIFQGCRDKQKQIDEVISETSLREGIKYTYKNVAYIGDDLLDLKCMEPIHGSGGCIGCPSDAIERVKEIADFISASKGGEGAVRDFIDWIVERKILRQGN